MTILNNNSFTHRRHPAATTILLGTIGFLCGFLLALMLAAHSLYSCTQIL